ncbi:hypothetical protein [Gloeobacter kilaueensis]|uniref:Uncharacterized protein n=1 Tax=Gloeobacter kilaueensis (strain ATCC BAA-2537 / CCAP 1431/1 / ULC 316 / JS1) TaxID=1183438 RepID=U5QEK0_GLOK1|nr:hypothetical protein [Gloeobacter kilaueensis]AGY57321.1 hypothetical protein GKIL_1075 [Gloeobacter kilaueensis JS1]
MSSIQAPGTFGTHFREHAGWTILTRAVEPGYGRGFIAELIDPNGGRWGPLVGFLSHQEAQEQTMRCIEAIGRRKLRLRRRA